MLQDPDRLTRLLLDKERPVQLIVAGKTHPSDGESKDLVRAMVKFASRPELSDRVVFLEDYDIGMAQKLVAGVDLWINTPRRGMEACGTSGMKVLVNGGLNLSELDGWWDEGYTPEVGWALGDREEHHDPDWDRIEADCLYRLIEGEIIPDFYQRDGTGIPRDWIRRLRASMSRLTPQFSSHRMMMEYNDRIYIPAAAAYHRRTADGSRLAKELMIWQKKLAEGWQGLRISGITVNKVGDFWEFQAQVYLGNLDPQRVMVELYADPLDDEEPVRIPMAVTKTIPGAVNDYYYEAFAPLFRPAEHYTPRIIPYHPDATIPLEENHILWPD
jgi:starch phosphorylase